MAKEEVIASTVGSLGRAKRLALAALGLTLLLGLTACSSSPTPEPTATQEAGGGAKIPGADILDKAKDTVKAEEDRMKEIDDMAKENK